MNWKKGGLWIILFFVIKGTLSTLLIITGAKYFSLSTIQIILFVIVLLLISFVGRNYIKKRKKINHQKDLNM